MTSPTAPITGVCVLGLGLIGGSLIRATAPLTSTFGWSRSDDTRSAATAAGYDICADLDSALERAAAEDALVVLATPIPAFPSLLRRLGELTPRVRLTDIASVKAPVAEVVGALAPHARYVGSHPMAGTQHSGWHAGSDDLFREAAWVTCVDDDTSIAAWTAVARLALALGCRVVPAGAEAHDDAVARISHLPHVLALALAQVGVDGGELAMSLAASSFADGTRVAATRPELVRAMCEANREALVDAFDDALGLIGVARASLSSTGSLERLTATGYQSRQSFERRGTALLPQRLTGPDLIDELVVVGAGGGHVVAIDGPDSDPEVSVLARPQPD